MHDGALLIVGVGGIGCRWAKVAHSEMVDSADLLLVDSDSSSFEEYPNASTININIDCCICCEAILIPNCVYKAVCFWES